MENPVGSFKFRILLFQNVKLQNARLPLQSNVFELIPDGTPHNTMPRQPLSELPSATATASDIQTFFIEILTEEYGISKDRAREISSKWQYGRRRELLNWPQSTYIELFDLEIGKILYGGVQRRLRREKDPGRCKSQFLC